MNSSIVSEKKNPQVSSVDVVSKKNSKVSSEKKPEVSSVGSEKNPNQSTVESHQKRKHSTVVSHKNSNHSSFVSSDSEIKLKRRRVGSWLSKLAAPPLQHELDVSPDSPLGQPLLQPAQNLRTPQD
ncbi:unnamed protein product [Arabis nemorensis]|uniref:Uncharacterized protein n=1 Tax=Arabis nemorensis TaxID=586526 RepID=A0A565CI37_9BRAS|nr:unnamed protein product [Arabis nemorensis]